MKSARAFRDNLDPFASLPPTPALEMSAGRSGLQPGRVHGRRRRFRGLAKGSLTHRADHRVGNCQHFAAAAEFGQRAVMWQLVLQTQFPA